MVFKETLVTNVDRSGARGVKVFHTYHRLRRRFARPGEYLKGSVRRLERWPIRIRGKRYRPTRVGFVLRGLFVYASFSHKMGGVFGVKGEVNAMITLKKRGVIKSPHILSPLIRPLRVKKFFYIFDVVLLKC